MRTFAAAVAGFVFGILFVAFAAMAQSRVNWNLDDDQRHVTITFDKSVNAMTLDVEEVVGIIANLGDFRVRMWPGEPKIYKLGQTVTVIPDPIWATEPDREHRDTLLHIRDPRFGWLHYLIPRDEARKLADYIQNQVTSPLREPQSEDPK